MSDQTILVTGAARFIGFHVTRRLLSDGRDVVGLDNLNAYYDSQLKEARLELLRADPRFTFVQADLADRAGVAELFARHRFRGGGGANAKVPFSVGDNTDQPVSFYAATKKATR
jgi:UDP-glucuronate 4-epimerase